MLHTSAGIPWHRTRVKSFALGLQRLGHTPIETHSTTRVSDAPAVLFGTTYFTKIESTPGDWLLIDRAGYGDPDFVRLGWNGLGREGEYCVPEEPSIERVASHKLQMRSLRPRGDRVIVCGDYGYVPEDIPTDATHFKPHPASNDNPTKLPIVRTLDHCCRAIVYRSTVAVECLLRGIPVEVLDPINIAYGWPRRHEFFCWLAYTQWQWTEIAAGEPIRHLFEWLQSKGTKSLNES